MTYTINIDQVRALDWGLNFQQAGLYSIMYTFPAWASSKIVDGEVWYFCATDKLIAELPLLTTKADTISKLKSVLVKKGLIDRKMIDNLPYIRLTSKSKLWNSKLPSQRTEGVSEKNPIPPGVGKKSDTVSEKNPTYHNTINHNTNVNDKIDDVTSEKKVLKGDVEGLELSKLLLSKMETLSEGFKPLTTVEGTASDIALMIRADKREPTEIKAVIDWLYADTRDSKFWRKNILSGKKLRKQFDRLKILMKESGFSSNGNNVTRDELHQYLIAEFGTSRSFMSFKNPKGVTIKVALFGPNYSLTDFNSGKYFDAKQSEWLWNTLIGNAPKLFPNFKG